MAFTLRATARLTACVCAVALAGCLPAHPAIQPTDGGSAGGATLRPDAFFLGVTEGVGALHIVGRGEQTVHVSSQGTPLADGSFQLVQQVTIGDAAPRERTWVMIPDGPATWTGTLDDASGPVRVRTDGETLHIRYRINAVTTFHQRLVLLADGQTVENRSSARVLGVPVARLTETITRATPVR